MKKSIIIAIIVAVVAIPAAVYAASPLFINTTIDEPLPVSTGNDVMKDENDEMVKEEDSMTEKPEMAEDIQLSGNFVGVGDGFHDAQGKAIVIPVDTQSVLRLEEFRSTNGPDLYVYLSTDNQATDYVDLGKLKANIGNQNYVIPDGTDLSKYDTVLIWCKSFSVLFGSAELTNTTSA
jgi:hypothetical protein